MSFTLFGSRSRGHQYESFVPSGENTGNPSKCVFPVRARISPEATSSTRTVAASLSPEWGVSTRTNARRFPSGDHERGDEGGLGGSAAGRLHVPDVSRFASPPSAGTSQTWTGIGGSDTYRLSLPTSNRSFPFSISALFGRSSSAANANALPSGRHAKCWTPVGAFVTICASPPAIGRTKICAFASFPLPSAARNARRSPVGDQRGWETPLRS